MKFNGDYVKLTVLLLAVAGLFSFSNYRCDKKKVKGIQIHFDGNENLYITKETVNKLLIQNYGSLHNVPKEKLVLSTMEKVVQANEMVKSAHVYLTVNGELNSKIVQRKPIGRVEGITKYYLDDEGKRMPLSKNHSARVPIITGEITGKSLEDVFVLLSYINQDDFLRKNVIGIHIEAEEKYQLKLRMENFVVHLGSVANLEVKFSNFLAFYNKANKDQMLDAYSMVNLEFDNQVVCSKI